ncbi:DUF1080 domain-containing protein [Planctomycetota bacterium]
MTIFRSIAFCWLLLNLPSGVFGDDKTPVSQSVAHDETNKEKGKAAKEDGGSRAEKNKRVKKKIKYKSLFDGKTLAGWKKTEFGGEGDVTIEKDGELVLDYGANLTGITYTKEFPKTNYEITVECRRIAGTDFFCGLTFPVTDSHCSLILGGWGGALVGLSTIDGLDASMNDTNQIVPFTKGKWYKVKLRVTPKTIVVWLEGKQIISQNLAKHKISVRPEVLPNCPLGFASFATQAGIRNIQYREIKRD